MGLFGVKLSMDALKIAAVAAKDKISETAEVLKDSTVELSGRVADTGIELMEKATTLSEGIVESAQDFDYEGAKEKMRATAADIEDGAKKLTRNAADTLTDWADTASDAINNFNYDESKESAVNFAKDSTDKLNRYIRSTLEIDKSTFQIINDVRKKLPVPAKTIDEIYEQCRAEAVRRAIATFMLGNILDEQSETKYDKLSDNYSTFRKTRASVTGNAHENYSLMQPSRDTPENTIFENGYNPDDPLRYKLGRGTNVTIDHVTSKYEIFQSILLKAGLTDAQLGDVMNDQRNLVYAARSINSQKSNLDIYDWLGANSKQHPNDSNKLIVTIKSTGEEHVLDKNALDLAYQQSKTAVSEGKFRAVKSITRTALTTGATMAAQQVVGLIVVETIDVFMDELKKLKFASNSGLIEEIDNCRSRISMRLTERFDERQIWARAKLLGIEAGVAGALSVIPQILISLILKMPAFVYAIIRESTLSVVRCVRVLLSDELEKLNAFQIILLGAASAIAGIYVQRVISQGISSVPLLNQFNSEISSVLSGMLIMAIPLAAIYTFEQNKNLFVLKLKNGS